MNFSIKTKTLSDKNLKGKLFYQSKQYSFYFADGTLHLFGNDEKHDSLQLFKKYLDDFSDQKVGEEIKTILLYGESSDNKRVIFLVHDMFNNENGYLSVKVDQIFLFHKSSNVEKNIEEKYLINKISFSGGDINYLYDPNNVYKYNLEEKGLTNISINDLVGEIINLGELKWTTDECLDQLETPEGDKQPVESNLCNSSTQKLIEMIITASISIEIHSDDPAPLNGESSINFELKDGIDLDSEADINTFITIYYALHCCIEYLLRRQNITIRHITFQSSCQQYELNGEFIDFTFNNSDTVELKNEERIRAISLNELNTKFSKLFIDFLNHHISIANLPKNRNEEHNYDPSREVMIFAVFEREFANLYGDVKAGSDELNEVKTDCSKKLNELGENYNLKKRKKLKSIEKYINNYVEVSSGDQIKKVIKDCDGIMHPILEYYFSIFPSSENSEIKGDETMKSYDENDLNQLCSMIGNFRNDIIHGHLNVDLQPNTIFSLKILECLLYAMRFKWLEMDDNEATRIIVRVTGYPIVS